MADRWPVRPLSELALNFDARRIPVKEVDRRPGEFPYYGASDIVGYVDEFLFDGEYCLVAEDGENLRTRKTSIAFLAKGKFWVNNHAHIIKANDRADTRFLMYALQAADIGGYLSGSTMPKLTQASLERVPIPSPPLHVQQDIAAILGALDDKIELNRKMSTTLEAMARAIFKSWFVDFDPVRAKAEGRQPEGMDEATAALFPDRFGEDGLPEGWRLGPLLELCQLKRGYDLPLTQRREGSVPIYSSSGVSGAHDQAQASPPGIVTGRYGTIGQVFFVEEPYWPLNTTLYVCDFKGHEPRYVYYILCDLPFGKYDDKAAVPGVNRNDLHREPVLLASRKIEEAFASLLAPVWERQGLNAQQVTTLACIRDLLLPHLVSGRLRVPEVGRMVEAAVA